MPYAALFRVVKQVTLTARDGRVSKLEQVYIRGSQVVARGQNRSRGEGASSQWQWGFRAQCDRSPSRSLLTPPSKGSGLCPPQHQSRPKAA